MICRTVGWTVLMLIVCVSPALHAACLVNDGDFTSTGGGCKDLDTGLVWSPDYRAHVNYSEGLSAFFPQSYCDHFNSDASMGGGFTDWRVPTVGEIKIALTNGINSHLDFFLNSSPDDFKYRWTACSRLVKGRTWRNYRHMVRFGDGHVVEADYTGGSPADVHMVCVRGLPQPTDCLGTGGGKPGKGNGKNNARGALSQTSISVFLLLPLAAVLGAIRLRERRS
jgi:hypothetical protein